MNKKKEETN